MRLPARAIAAAALVPLGTVAGHVAGYALAGEDASFSGGHSHLRPLTWLIAAVAALALGWVAAARDGLRRPPPMVALATAQAGLFVALESVEHLAAGYSPAHLLHEPVLRWGLAAQLATAALLVVATVVARATGERVRALLSAPAPRAAAPAARPVRPRSSPRASLGACSPATERGPPAIRLVPA